MPSPVLDGCGTEKKTRLSVAASTIGVADHDLDTGKPLIGKDAIDSPRGALFQNTGGTYLYGVAAEHSSQYQ